MLYHWVMKEYLTISELAKMLKKSTKTLRRWDEEGKLYNCLNNFLVLFA